MINGEQWNSGTRVLRNSKCTNTEYMIHMLDIVVVGGGQKFKIFKVPNYILLAPPPPKKTLDSGHFGGPAYKFINALSRAVGPFPNGHPWLLMSGG